mgnify:FL=1
MNIKYTKRLCKSLWRDIKRPTYKGIRVSGASERWIPSFIADRLHYSHLNDVACYTVNSFPELIRWDRHKYRFLHVMENVHVYQAHWELFADIQNKKYAPDLVIGFDNISLNNYIRFPYWLIDNFTP